VRRLARFLRWFATCSGVGITVPVGHLVFIGRFFVLNNSEIHHPTPNVVGALLAGVLGPLATFWPILGFFQQGHEPRNSTDALRQQQEQITCDLAFRRYRIERGDGADSRDGGARPSGRGRDADGAARAARPRRLDRRPLAAAERG
jgi:hypothetical protein